MEIFLTVGAALISALFLGEAAERLGEPGLLGEILAGVILGPHLLGLLDVGGEFSALAAMGAVLLLFDAGYEEVELGPLVNAVGPALLIALLGMAIPFTCGLATGLYFGYPLLQSLFLALALSITAIAVTARVLIDIGRLGTPYGARLIGAAVVDDVLGLLGFSVLLVVAEGGSSTGGGIAGSVAGALLFFAAALLFYRVVGGMSRMLFGSVQRGADFLGIMGVLFVFSYLAEVVGLDAMVGAFAAGLIVGSEERLEELEVREGITGIAYGVFIPLFFVYVGARLDFASVSGMDPLILTVVAVGIAGKLLGGYLGNRLAGGDHGESLVVGVGMVPRTGVELAIVGTALGAGIIDERLFSAVLALVVVSVLVTPSLLHRAVGALQPAPSA
ncbi:MAG: Glutathione-regulated potassium-efflux system protein KefC [Methanonatronarchaeales archaeon]|nr:Glutathione-regulated potassium-efflux system protein KefC [Methanonatronarchaeales archaeon]